MSAVAPNLTTLFNLEPAIEEGWKKLLKRAKISGFTSRETEKLPLERVDIQFTAGGHTGHRSPRGTFGGRYLDTWNGQLTLGIVTERKAIDPTGEHARKADPFDRLDTHNRIRARVRILAQYATGALTESLLPWHTMTQIQESGCTDLVRTVDDCDVSEISFACVVSIRTDAWGAVADDTPVLGTPAGEVIDLGGGILLRL